MVTLEKILSQFGEAGLETSFRVQGKTYHVFAYPTPGHGNPGIRWNLYETQAGEEAPLRGVTFGIALGVREAMEDVLRAAEEHRRFGKVETTRRPPLSFRPAPND